MKETERIEDQLKRAFYGEAWHGPSVKEALEGVTAEIAARKPLQDAHSIWDLVHHITTWVDVVRRRALGEVFTVTEEMNFPAVTDTSERAFKDLLARMEAAEMALRKAILQIPDSRLEEITIEGGPSIYTLLHGAVQHSLYHAGQIVLLKKAIHKVDVS